MPDLTPFDLSVTTLTPPRPSTDPTWQAIEFTVWPSEAISLIPSCNNFKPFFRTTDQMQLRLRLLIVLILATMAITLAEPLPPAPTPQPAPIPRFLCYQAAKEAPPLCAPTFTPQP